MMETYRIISDVGNVPPMEDLTAAYAETPNRRGDVFTITFSQNYGLNPAMYEPAVGRGCRVTRTRDGQSREGEGSVTSIAPVAVSLNGVGWQ